MSFADIEDTMCKEEMKSIMGGSGMVGSGGSFLGGSLEYGGTNPRGFDTNYWASSAGWAPNNFDNSWGSSPSGAVGGSNPNNYTNGWVQTSNGISTNSPEFINRFSDFLKKSNGLSTNEQISSFINNEGTPSGQRQNSMILYGTPDLPGTILNNVTVANNYKAPSTLPKGVSYNNGILGFSNYGEEPVNFFADGKNRFNGVADSRSYTIGDGKFTLFGHGAPGFILDEKHSVGIRNATDFDKYMELMNSNWTNAKDKNGTILSLWSCQSGTVSQNNLSIAQMISLAHPNITVTGADGFVNYGEKDGLYRITGIDTVMDSGKNDGAIVAYKNGVEVYRRQY
ncbi:hypothetical protein [Flavobacterium aquidurense]|uniref:hypothetical protein n=1 Tax=Flavobacterium aquidurense TaxID=362413 RepID=UPI0028578ED2|nr:hypothetical protein [Flavobacterium aquidurense]MDR7370784.1 hypothetical protein [Flavobacterium aquidurense]